MNPRRVAALLSAALCVFAGLAMLVATGRTLAFDAALRAAVHACTQPELTAAMRVATFLGGGELLWPLGVLVAAWLAWTGRRPEAARFAIAVVAANLVDEAIKWAFHRPRPQPWFGSPVPSSYSFPSGHAFMSCVFYLLLAAAVIRPEWAPWRKRTLWMAALLLILAIGLSRVYLGVHYPTDVLAGYLAAIAWLAGLRLAAKAKGGPVARSPL